MQTDHRAGLGGYGDTAYRTEFVGGEERFLLICTDADLDARVHRIFLVCNQPTRTTPSLLQISVSGKVQGGSLGQGWDSRKDNRSNIQ